MTKRIISVVLIAIIALTLFCSCAKKFSPSIKLNSDNITSVEFKKTIFGLERTYKQKTITQDQDIKALCDWLTSLRLTKHEAIEIPVEKIRYTIILKGAKEHRVIFMDEYIIYDNDAYTFNRDGDIDSVSSRYDLLNYTETDAKLGLIS